MAVFATNNICGYHRKYPLLQKLVEANSAKVICLQETKLRTGVIRLGQFTSYQRNCNNNSITYGEAVLIHQSLPSRPHALPTSLHHINCVAAEAKINGSWIVVISVYIKHSQLGAITALINYANKIPKIVIMGDLNARSIGFGDSVDNARGKELEAALQNSKMLRVENNQATYVGYNGHSVIDHVVVSGNIHSSFSRCYIGHTTTSDHEPLLTNFGNTALGGPTVRTIRRFKLANWNLISNRIDERLKEFSVINGIEEAATNLNSIIQEEVDKGVPTSTVHPFRLQLPPAIITKIKEKRRLYRKINKDRTNTILKQEHNRLNAIIRREVQEFKREQWLRKCSNLDHRDGGRFWKEFKAMTGQCTRQRITLSKGTDLTNEPAEVSELFAEHLEAVFTDHLEAEFHGRHHREVESGVDLMLEGEGGKLEPITLEELDSAIAQGKSSAPGESGITRNIIRKIKTKTLTNKLLQLYNKCLDEEVIPAVWKSAVIINIHKPKKRADDPASYRPISLLEVLGKILERILKNRLDAMVDELNILPYSQRGFRPGLSTHTIHLELHTEAARTLNNKLVMSAMCLDFERAFDKVWHSGLIYKLNRCGLPGGMVRLLANFLRCRTFRVKTEGHLSQIRSQRAGIPQGSLLSPTLYNIYCADIPQPTNEHTILLQYADDTAIYTRGRTLQNSNARMRKYVETLGEWLVRWRIKPNPDKTQLTAFGSKKSASVVRIEKLVRLPEIWGKEIKYNNQIKYLGITYDRGWGFSKDTTEITKQIKQRSGLLSRVRCAFGKNVKTLIHTYKSFIRPLIDYRKVHLTTEATLLEGFARLERVILRRARKLRRNTRNVEVIPEDEAVPSRLFKLLRRQAENLVTHGDDRTRQILTKGFKLRNINFPPQQKYLKMPSLTALASMQNLTQPQRELLDSAPEGMYSTRR